MSTENPYNYFASVVTSLLMGNIQTLETHNNTLNLFTTTNQALTESWTSGMPDPNSAMGQLLNKLSKETGNNADIVTFIDTYIVNPTGSMNIDDFSQAVGTILMEALSANWDTNNGPNQLQTINQLNSLITSTGQNEEQLGQNEAKTMSSVLQQDAGAQQPLADIGSAVNTVSSNAASLLQQQY